MITVDRDAFYTNCTFDNTAIALSIQNGGTAVVKGSVFNNNQRNMVAAGAGSDVYIDNVEPASKTLTSNGADVQHIDDHQGQLLTLEASSFMNLRQVRGERLLAEPSS